MRLQILCRYHPIKRLPIHVQESRYGLFVSSSVYLDPLPRADPRSPTGEGILPERRSASSPRHAFLWRPLPDVPNILVKASADL